MFVGFRCDCDICSTLLGALHSGDVFENFESQVVVRGYGALHVVQAPVQAVFSWPLLRMRGRAGLELFGRGPMFLPFILKFTADNGRWIYTGTGWEISPRGSFLTAQWVD